MNPITTRLNVDNLLLQALREDISDEDVTTNSVMRSYKKGEAQLICKGDGIIAGMDIFQRVFELLEPEIQVEKYASDGAEVKKAIYLRSCGAISGLFFPVNERR